MFLKKNRRELYWGVVFLLSCHGLFAQTAPGDGRAGYALPLETTRTVDFTTDEGTWLSLDVSPDGSQIVFDLMGDLYLLPMEGGDATRITKGPAWDNQPRFSPDGREIVFVSDRDGTDNLWLISADGSDLRSITRHLQPHLRADPCVVCPEHVSARARGARVPGGGDGRGCRVRLHNG